MLKCTQALMQFCKRAKPLYNEVSTRQMSRVKTRFTMPPFWQPKKTRVLYPEHVTPDNEEFITKHIEKKYNSPLKADIYEKGIWTPNSYRCGLITRKLGTLPMWLKDGTRILTTLLQVCDNHVVKYIPPEELQKHDFYYKRRVQRKDRPLGALVVGADSADPRLMTKEYLQIFESAGVMPKKKLTKFFITPNARLPPGFPLHAYHFQPGDFVDVAGVTIDRGFQGVMKRWGFKGNRATHGVTKSHRRPGNIGGGGGAKARVWPGTKMPGHMGRHFRKLKGQKIMRVNTKHNVLWIRGRAVPGEVGNYVILYDSMLPQHRRTESKKDYFPTFVPSEEPIMEDQFVEELHDFSSPTITFAQDPE